MARPSWKRFAKPAIKATLALLVLGAVGRHVARTWQTLSQHGDRLRFDVPWLIAAGVLYLAGLLAFGIFFARVLAASATPIGTAAAVRAYVVSHVAKYVPGKAMVVVVRVGLAVPYGARRATAAAATFYETLVMMAAGAMVAAVGFVVAPGPIQVAPALLAAGLAVGFLGIVEPRVFPRVAGLVTRALRNVGPDALPALSHRLLGVGLAWTILGWAFLGLSQVAVLRAVVPAGIAPSLWPLVTASVALATVAGFVVALVPGGLGVREGVLMATLGPAVGNDRAVIAALALRLVWVVVEVAAALVLMVAPPAMPVLLTPPHEGAAPR